MGQWALRTVEGGGWRAAAAVLGEYPRLRPVRVLSPAPLPLPRHGWSADSPPTPSPVP